MSNSNTTTSMSMHGRIVEVYEEGLVTFKVRTRLGFGFVWVWEEIDVDFRAGMEFDVDEAPVTFSDGYPVAVIKPGVIFSLGDLVYQITDPDHSIS